MPLFTDAHDIAGEKAPGHRYLPGLATAVLLGTLAACDGWQRCPGGRTSRFGRVVYLHAPAWL